MKITKDGRRQFSRAFKLGAIKRVESGEKQADVARELGIAIPMLGRWRQRFREGGQSALGEIGRPIGETKPQKDRRAKNPRIAELERMVGRQQEAIDFLEQALHQVGELRRPKNGAGAKGSSR